jgi:hypothetical protein
MAFENAMMTDQKIDCLYSFTLHSQADMAIGFDGQMPNRLWRFVFAGQKLIT